MVHKIEYSDKDQRSIGCSKVNSALKAQLDKLWHTTCIYHTEPVLEYAAALTAKLPEHLSVRYLWGTVVTV